jgi:hypothetical protein
MANRPVVGWHEGWSFSRFVNRHLRWAVMRRQVSKAGYLVEPLLTPGPVLIMALLAGLAGPEYPLNLPTAFGALALKFGVDAVTNAKLTGGGLSFTTMGINALREWLTLAVWALGWLVQTIQWRGKPNRVVAGSALEPVTTVFGNEARDEI